MREYMPSYTLTHRVPKYQLPLRFGHRPVPYRTPWHQNQQHLCPSGRHPRWTHHQQHPELHQRPLTPGRQNQQHLEQRGEHYVPEEEQQLAIWPKAADAASVLAPVLLAMGQLAQLGSVAPMEPA